MHDHLSSPIPERLVLVVGPPRVGKTTLVQRVMVRSKLSFGGFFTLATPLDVPGARSERSFKLVTLSGTGERDMPEPHMTLIHPCAVPEWSTFRISELETRGVDALRAASRNVDVVIIDELGALQLRSHGFRQAFDECLASGIMVVGTASHRANPHIEDLVRRPDCRTFSITPDNRAAVAMEVVEHLYERRRRLSASSEAGVASLPRRTLAHR